MRWDEVHCTIPPIGYFQSKLWWQQLDHSISLRRLSRDMRHMCVDRGVWGWEGLPRPNVPVPRKLGSLPNSWRISLASSDVISVQGYWGMSRPMIIRIISPSRFLILLFSFCFWRCISSAKFFWRCNSSFKAATSRLTSAVISFWWRSSFVNLSFWRCNSSFKAATSWLTSMRSCSFSFEAPAASPKPSAKSPNRFPL